MGAVGDTVVELMADVTMEGMTDAGVEVAVKDAEEKREEKEKEREKEKMKAEGGGEKHEGKRGKRRIENNWASIFSCRGLRQWDRTLFFSPGPGKTN